MSLKRQKLLTTYFIKKSSDEAPTDDVESGYPSTELKNLNGITESSSKPTSSNINVNTFLDASAVNERDPSNGPILAKKFISVGAFQPDLLHFPVTNGRKFRREWYKEYSWLEYSPLSDKTYCFVCRFSHQGTAATSKADDAFTTKGFCNWKKAVSSFESHQKSQSHLNSSVKLSMLKETERSGTVAEKLSEHFSRDVEENRKYLYAVCECLIFCGRQTIPLRGHNESESSKNKGNFLELMELRCKDNALLKSFFINRQKNFRYTDGKFQNELLSIIGDQMKSDIAEKVKKCGIFSIIADETQDISKHEQVSVILRYVEENMKIHESFVGFYRAERCDGEALALLLKSVILALDLDIKNLRGQCYDGAANMRGIHKGVATRILTENPVAMYVHCHAHILNLCIVSFCKGIQSIRNTFHILQSLYIFIEGSAKRHSVFETIRKSSKSFTGGTLTLKSLSDTRWYCRVEAVRALLDNLDTTIAALHEIAESNPTCGGEAYSLLKCIEDFHFVFDMLLLRRVLTQCDILSKTLQSPQLNYGAVKDVVKVTVEVLQSFRSDDFFHKLWNLCSELVQKYNFRPAELPRASRVPMKYGGGNKNPYDTVQQFYKTTILYPLVDTLVEEMSNRFSENDLDMLMQLSVLLKSDEIDNLATVTVCRYYSLNKEHLQAELECFYRIETFKGKGIEERADLLVERDLKGVLPMIFYLFRLYFTIPMNSASSERSFSCLRRLKTYCRNTGGQERLSSLALLAIEHDIDIDLEHVVNVFDRGHQRRLHFI